MIYYLTRLAGLLILISTISFCTSKSEEDVKELKSDRIKLTKYKRQISKIYDRQTRYENKVQDLVRKLKLANTPREKGKYVTRIQRYKRKLEKVKKTSDFLKTKIIELENQGVTPIED